MDPQELLERMASISPGVRLQITGRLWLENIDEDEINQQMLINECFAIMINEAYEIGIEFYCTMSDLCESYYIIDQTLILFEIIFPTPLYKSITESDSFRKMISSVVTDGVSDSGESSIQTIMEYLGVNNEATTDIFFNSYVFLQDKMKSTPVFDIYVQSMLDIDNTPISTEINETYVKAYLDHIQKTITKLLNAADVLTHKAPDIPDFAKLYDAINEYKVRAIDSSTLWEYSWAYDMKNQDPSDPVIQALIEKYRIQFDASVPFFEEYYELRGVPITSLNLVTLLLGSYVTAFMIDNDSSMKSRADIFLSKSKELFNKLQFLGKIKLSDINLFIQKISLILIQEISSD